MGLLINLRTLGKPTRTDTPNKANPRALVPRSGLYSALFLVLPQGRNVASRRLNTQLNLAFGLVALHGNNQLTVEKTHVGQVEHFERSGIAVANNLKFGCSTNVER